MAKKKKKKQLDTDASTNGSTDQELESREDSSLVEAAAEKVRQAREQLRRAEELYERAREKASEHVEKLRETTVGEMVDQSMETVKKYPGLSVLAATAVGFLLGRMFRK